MSSPSQAAAVAVASGGMERPEDDQGVARNLEVEAMETRRGRRMDPVHVCPWSEMRTRSEMKQSSDAGFARRDLDGDKEQECRSCS